MKKLISILAVVLCAALCLLAADSIAGKWTLAMDSPHGPVKGDLQIQQDGAKVTGSYVVEPFGTLALTGAVEGKKVSFQVTTPDGGAFAFTGTLEGAKMSGTTEVGGSWTATRQ